MKIKTDINIFPILL